jgi:hypothetical protein
MAIAVVQEFKGGTLSQYDEVVERMGFDHAGQGAPGCLFHWAAQTEDGLRITDVWEAREQFEAFAHEQVGPRTAEVGVQGPSEITHYEVHNYLTARQAAAV